MAKTTTVPAASFKARCLELMDRVRETRETYIVTKHGKPVAKLVPYEDVPHRPFLGSMAGTLLKYERPFDPIDGEWDMDAILNPPARVPKRQPRKRR
jgi:prevent-host-death family protein